MKAEELLKRFENEFKGLSEKDKVEMILSNFIDIGGSMGGCISVKQFDKISNTIIKYYNSNRSTKNER